MKGISRMDSRNTHGWFVRVYRESKVHSKLFSDGRYGGKREALTAARRYKAEYEKEHPQNPNAQRIRRKPQKNNRTTGITGISETFSRNRKGVAFPCFCITWSPQPGQRRNKRIYHHQYDSRDAALEAAIAFRKAREAEILGEVVAEPSGVC